MGFYCISNILYFPRGCVPICFCSVSGPAVEYNGQTRHAAPTPPPLLGEHTNEVLTDLLGYTDLEIMKLEDEGVVKCYFENPFL